MSIYEMKKPKRINSFSVTLFVGAALLAYAGYFFIPVWWPVFQLSGIMKGICNDMYREFDNDKLMEKLLKESKRTGLYLSKENFKMERIPYTPEDYGRMNVKPEAQMNYDRRGKSCRLTLTYTSKAEWPWIGKYSQIPWNRSVETDLATIVY